MVQRPTMSDLLLSAIFTAFTTVRVLRGPWLRNPQYLASGIVGAIVGALLLHGFWPAYDDDLIIGGVTGIFGSWAGMALFDAILGLA
jgi:membrane associated rhomboid family serine protease